MLSDGFIPIQRMMYQRHIIAPGFRFFPKSIENQDKKWMGQAFAAFLLIQDAQIVRNLPVPSTSENVLDFAKHKRQE